jgi:hypothetical protein
LNSSSVTTPLTVKLFSTIPFIQFQDEGHIHKYFDVASFPYDFESDKKIDSKQITVDGKMGN